MNKLFIVVVLTLISISIVLSCQRVVKWGELKTDELSNLEGIPLEYGSLISATTLNFNTSLLWFEDDDGTVRAVRIGVNDNSVAKKVLVISRY
jgi:hypothetical protein